MRAGPKKAAVEEPLGLGHLPEGRAERAIAFIEGFLQVPKGVGAKEPVHLRSWQRDIIRGIFAPGVRQALVSIPRGNGKSALAAFLALYALFADEVEGAQVLTVAADERQARIVFNGARRMIELNPLLAERVQIHADRIVVPGTDSVLMPLPANPASLQGWDPSFCVVDELHVVNDETYEAMLLASGKRPHSTLLSISTPAGDQDGVMWRLVEAGRAGTDPSLYFREFAARHGADKHDREAWKMANPAMGDFLAEDAIAASLRSTRAEAFMRYRLGMWVGQTGAWMPWGLWDTLAAPREVAPGTDVVLGFDGSASGDSTALIACTVPSTVRRLRDMPVEDAGQPATEILHEEVPVEPPYLFVLGVWENPGDLRWRVPRSEVTAAVYTACQTYNVLELAADPWGWRSELEAWSSDWPQVIEWPTNVVQRMAPATDRFYQAANDDPPGLTHDGDPRLAAHVAHCVAKATAQGDLVYKDRKGSPRKIDAAVAAIVALDRATWWHKRNAGRSVYEEAEVMVA